MSVSNEDLFAWVQQARTDRPGVRLALDGLEPDEARDVAARIFSYLGAFVIEQDQHIDALNGMVERGEFGALPTLEDRHRVLQEWIQRLPAGSVALAQIMHAQDPDREDGGAA